MSIAFIQRNQVRLEAGTAQHIGDREEQQDRVAILTAPKAPGYVMVVLADGMGGVSGGTLAAEQVMRTAKISFDLFSPKTDSVESLLESVVREAHTLIKLTAMASEKQPHSTIVALVLTPEQTAYWTHIGDSRLYWFRGPNCATRTQDHSYVQTLVADGSICMKDAANHPMAHVLTMALGSNDAEPAVKVRSCAGLQPGDAFLLCSDGLWTYFSDAELGAQIAVNPPREASEALIEKARERAQGSGDNCSLAIAKFIAMPPTKSKGRVNKQLRHVG